MSVMIDNKEVPASEIDFEKHKYIGLYRPPENKIWVKICPCGMDLTSRRNINDHYKAGHFDIPCYRSKT